MQSYVLRRYCSVAVRDKNYIPGGREVNAVQASMPLNKTMRLNKDRDPTPCLWYECIRIPGHWPVALAYNMIMTVHAKAPRTTFVELSNRGDRRHVQPSIQAVVGEQQ